MKNPDISEFIIENTVFRVSGRNSKGKAQCPLSRKDEGIFNLIIKVPRYPRVALTCDKGTTAEAIKNVTATSAKLTQRVFSLVRAPRTS